MENGRGKKYYAAHGFFINTARMADMCPTAAGMGAGELKGYRLLFRGAHAEAVAALEPDKDATISVLVWEITTADEAALDICEGFPVRCRKETVKVKLDGKAASAMVYIMNEETPPGRPGAYHYESILEGYEAAGFDTETLRKALLTSVEMAEAIGDWMQ